MTVEYLNLWEKITQITEKALLTKALHPIPTNYEIIKQNNLIFIVRILENIARKENAKKVQKKIQKITKYNPFLPYEKNLYVGDLGTNHVCILNKYNVVNNHVLIITRHFEPQEKLLNLADLHAFWSVLKQVSGLGFYNAGKCAGASQPHKHLQIVPYPLVSELTTIPMDNLVLSYQDKVKVNQLFSLDELPYQQCSALLTTHDKSALECAKLTWDLYRQMLSYLKLEKDQNNCLDNYNFLITKNWLMMIPRRQPEYNSISINSLGFAGALLVKNQTQLQLLKEYQPLKILQEVGISK